MYCPACGKAIADGSAFCMHCGKATGLGMQPTDAIQPVGIHVAQVPPANSPFCPSCGQIDEARRVIGMVAEGTALSQGSTASSGTGTGLAGAVGRGGLSVGASSQSWSSVSRSQGASITVLAALLATPMRGVSAYNVSLMPPDPMRSGTEFYVQEMAS